MPSSDYLFASIGSNTKTGVRIGEKGCKVIGAYGRDNRVSDINETSLLRFAEDDNMFALVKVLFVFPKDVRLVHSTVTGPRIRNVLTTSSRGNHTASLSEISLSTCSYSWGP